jgi:hypothetical protein
MSNMKFKNTVKLTGTIQGLKDYVKYIPEPIVSFNLHVFRRPSKSQQYPVFDLLRIVVFNNEKFPQQFSDGDRIRIKGELQSRNYTVDNYKVDKKIENAVNYYYEFFEAYPCKEQPTKKARQEIDWSKLLNTGLLPIVPHDSLLLENGNKADDRKGKYVYRIDEDGVVYKEKQHVTYEVIATSYEKIDGEIDYNVGDKNITELVGEVMTKSSKPTSNNRYQRTKFSIKTHSKFFPDRFYYLHLILWEDMNKTKSKRVQESDTVRVLGRLQSKSYERDVQVMRKKVARNFTTREISVSEIKTVHS